jgi:CheY-like chemotaxis protein
LAVVIRERICQGLNPFLFEGDAKTFDSGVNVLLISHSSPMPVLPSAVPNVLLIDDNRDGLLVRKSLLEEAGYSVSVAVSGEEGFKIFQSAPFDVVVTDYRMPRMNGVELIERIRALDPNARIILLSGFVVPLGLTEESTGADAVISKSASEAQHLVRWVKRLANRAAASRKPPAAQKRSAVAPARASSR